MKTSLSAMGRRRRLGLIAIVVLAADLLVAAPVPSVTAATAAIGVISTYAGGSTAKKASELSLAPESVTVAGDIAYVPDTTNHVVWGLNIVSGAVEVVAGNGSSRHGGDGGPATAAGLHSPADVALDGQGNLYIADSGDHRVRRVDTSGIITTVAGNGSPAFYGDGGPADAAALNGPRGIGVDPANGELYIADTKNHRVRKVAASVISTFAGTDAPGSAGDGGPATAASMNEPNDVAVGPNGSVVIADSNNYVVRLVAGGTISTVAGTYGGGDADDGSPATSVVVLRPTRLVVEPGGGFYISEQNGHRIRKVTGALPGGSGSTPSTVSTVAGSGAEGFSGDGGPATAAALRYPNGVGLDEAGNVYFADGANLRIRMVVKGTISRFAGDGFASALVRPRAMAMDNDANVYVATGDHRVRKIAPDRTISTVAGTGTPGFSGDGGPASEAKLNSPAGLVVDGAGNLFIADSANHRIRRVDTDGNISTIGGTGSSGSTGDGDLATTAKLSSPRGMALDHEANLFIGDWGNGRIRRIDADDKTMSSFASGLNPEHLSFDRTEQSIYVAETQAGRVIKLDSAGAVARIVSGQAVVRRPGGVAVGPDGAVYVSDSNQCQIRRFGAQGAPSVVAGNGACGLSGDGGPGWTAQLSEPSSLVLDPEGNLFVADTFNHRVRRIERPGEAVTRDGAVGSWSPVPPMGTPRMMPGAAPLAGGGALVVGGIEARRNQETFPPLATAERFDEATDTWSPTGAMAPGASSIP